MTWTLWDALDGLQHEDADLYRLEAHITSGGYSMDVFAAEPDRIEAIILPWQSDMDRVVDEGQLGHTPGLKAYVDPDLDIGRNDRVHYKGGAFRVANPQYNAARGVVRLDLRTDDREFTQTSDVDLSQHDYQEPDRSGFGGF